MRKLLLALPLILAAAQAQAAERLLVVELFTSQGCSSCPPADALLSELARTDPTLLPLDLHVTYWDRLGWKDPFSLPQVTARQRAYSGLLGLDTIYTPQIVVGGRYQAVGSDRDAVTAALTQARRAMEAVPLSIRADSGGLRIQAGAGPGAGTLYLVGFDPGHNTPVRGGENTGRVLAESNVVRSFAQAGAWRGAPLTVVVPAPEGERAAVLLQADDGRILAAASLP